VGDGPSIATGERPEDPGTAVRSLTREALVSLFQSDPQMCFLVDTVGRIVAANGAAATELGFAADELTGRPVLELFHPDDRAAVAEHIAECRREPAARRSWEVRKLRRDGTAIDVVERAHAVAWDRGEPDVLVLCENVTRQRRAERRLARLNRTLLDLGAGFQTDVDALTAACGELLGASYALYNRVEGDTVRTASAWNAPPDLAYQDRGEGRLCADVAARGPAGSPLVVRDLQRTTWAESDPTVRRHGLATYAGHPVRLPEGAFGSLCVVFDRDVALVEDDLGILKVLAAAIGNEEQRRSAGAALAAGTQRFRVLFECNPLMCFLVDASGRVLLVNNEGARELGYTPDELTGRDVIEVFHPDDRAAARADLEECLREPSRGHTWELRKIRRDGTLLWVSETAQAVEDEAGRETVFVVCQNVSERKRAAELQEAIYEISEAAHGTSDLGALFAAIHRTVGRLMDARNFYIALHDPATDLMTFAYWVDEQDLCPAPMPPGHGLTGFVLRTGRSLLASPERFAELQASGEVDLIGSPSIDWLGVPLVNDGETIGALVVQTYVEGVRYGAREEGILTFVSHRVAEAIARKRAEASLRESESRYRGLVENIQDGVFVIADGRVAFANEAFAAAFGRTVADVVGRRFEELVAPEDADRVRGLQRDRLAGLDTPDQYEIRCRHADGIGRTQVSLHVSTIEDRGARTILGTMRDLTEHRRLEEQVRLSQRIESLGLLAGGVAHDFNNLLKAIMGSAELLARRLGDAAQPAEEIETIRRSSHRAAELTRGLLAFARRQVLESTPLDLNQVVDAVLPILRRVIPEDIRIEFTPAPAPAGVLGDRGQLDQVLMNLAVNCRDAMPDGGTIRIATATVDLGAEYCAARPWAKPGRYSMIAVADTGTGMSAHVLEHIFEPFFTTKERSRGTGLGLSVVFGIVKQHDGMIDAESTPGVGTIFRIYFPALVEPAPPLAREQPAITPGGYETILVVEDEAEVRHILERALTEYGYRVVEAADGADALATLSAGQEVDLVVSDVVMPRMGGLELFRRSRSLDRPPLFLFSSGYGESLRDGGLVAGQDVEFIAKPYGIQTLAARIRSILDGAAGPAARRDEPAVE
jgi:PAS domain S-box-containing protein